MTGNEIVDQDAADALLRKYKKTLSDAARDFWMVHRDEYDAIQTSEFPLEKDTEMTHQFLDAVDDVTDVLARSWTLTS